MILKPLRDRVLIKPELQPTMTESGLHLAEHAKPEQLGTVVAIGPQVKEVIPGELVTFSWQVGQELLVDNGQTRYFMMREGDILAVVEH